MLILDMEQTDETISLGQLLQNWKAKLRARLLRQPLPEAQANKETDKNDHPAGLIL